VGKIAKLFYWVKTVLLVVLSLIIIVGMAGVSLAIPFTTPIIHPGMVTGQLTTTHGSPVPGATVTLYSTIDNSVMSTKTTDSSGGFTFTALIPGEGLLIKTKSSYCKDGTYGPFSVGNGENKAVAISIVAYPETISITAPRNYVTANSNDHITLTATMTDHYGQRTDNSYHYTFEIQPYSGSSYAGSLGGSGNTHQTASLASNNGQLSVDFGWVTPAQDTDLGSSAVTIICICNDAKLNDGQISINVNGATIAHPSTGTANPSTGSAQPSTGTPSDTTPPVSIMHLVTSGTVDTQSPNTYTSDVVCTFTAQDNSGGSGLKAIYYGVDNSDQSSFIVYASPFTISAEGPHKVYFYSIDNANNKEEVRAQDINIHKTVDIYGNNNSSGFGITVTVNPPVNDDGSNTDNGQTLLGGINPLLLIGAGIAGLIALIVLGGIAAWVLSKLFGRKPPAVKPAPVSPPAPASPSAPMTPLDRFKHNKELIYRALSDPEYRSLLENDPAKALGRKITLDDTEQIKKILDTASRVNGQISQIGDELLCANGGPCGIGRKANKELVYKALTDPQFRSQLEQDPAKALGRQVTVKDTDQIKKIIDTTKNLDSHISQIGDELLCANGGPCGIGRKENKELVYKALTDPQFRSLLETDPQKALGKPLSGQKLDEIKNVLDSAKGIDANISQIGDELLCAHGGPCGIARPVNRELMYKAVTDPEFRSLLETDPQKALGKPLSIEKLEEIKKMLSSAKGINANISQIGDELLCANGGPCGMFKPGL
jgi:hypothetical protein